MKLSILTLLLALRPDLASYSSYFCVEQPQALEDKPLPDAQIELAFVKTDREVKDLAKEFAKENGHRGYSYGTCPNGKTYVVSTPSAEPIVLRKNDAFVISAKALKDCRQSEVSVIEADSSFPRTLAKGLTNVSSQGIQAISVSCIPKDKPDAGPELWALLTPKFENIGTQKSIEDLLAWINDSRRKLKLPELKSLPKLDETAREAARSKNLEHPHALLLSKKSTLQKDKIQLLGENRAISSSFTGLANLFWNSPEHRSLLLNAKANAIGYALDEVHGQRLLVLVLAHVEP